MSHYIIMKAFVWSVPGAARFQVENQSRCNFGITICSANWRFRNAHVPYFRSPPLQDLLWPRARAKYFHSNCIVFFYKVTFDTYASKSHSSPAVNTSWHATVFFVIWNRNYAEKLKFYCFTSGCISVLFQFSNRNSNLLSDKLFTSSFYAILIQKNTNYVN